MRSILPPPVISKLHQNRKPQVESITIDLGMLKQLAKILISSVFVSYDSIVPRLLSLQNTCKQRNIETMNTFVIFMVKMILLLYDSNRRPINILVCCKKV